MKALEKLQILRKEKIPVSTLMDSLCKLSPVNEGIGEKKLISSKNLYRPQLALAGYVGLFNYDQVQIFGNTEHYYLASLEKNDRHDAFETLCRFPIPCIILTNNNILEPELVEIATNYDIPIYSTHYETTKTNYILSEFLDDQFAPQAVIHGSFVDVYGVGLLFTGRSGIGKSEIALDLVERGHRLVADDIVMLTQKRDSVIMGTGTSMVQHFMEVRGLGIIDVRQMFGIRSIRFQKRLEIIVELEEWSQNADYTRTGLDERPESVMGVDVQYVKLPIFPGKNITVIAEVIAINYLLRTYGYNAAKVLTDKLQETIKKRSSPDGAFADQRIINYFQGDNE